MEEAKIKFFSKDLMKVGAIASIWYILIFKGFSEFFVAFGMSPASALSEMLGALIIPIVPTYFLARFLSMKKDMSFIKVWIVGVVVIISVSTIGMLNGQHRWW